jgi:HAD superfamily hydrolase (TIGR01509 family)
MTTLKQCSVKAVLIDLDGTLANSIKALEIAYIDFLKIHGIKGTHDEFVQLSGPSLQEIIEKLKEKYQLRPSIAELYAVYLKILKYIYAEEIKPNQGAYDFLLQLQEATVTMALVTSAPRLLADIFLKTHNWQHFFQSLITGDDIKISKPNPAIYLEALSILSISADQAVAIEDSVNGVKAAVDAGIGVVGISPNDGALLSLAGAAAVVTNFSEIIPIIIPVKTL